MKAVVARTHGPGDGPSGAVGVRRDEGLGDVIALELVLMPVGGVLSLTVHQATDYELPATVTLN
jgi:hypothetical protein